MSFHKIERGGQVLSLRKLGTQEFQKATRDTARQLGVIQSLQSVKENLEESIPVDFDEKMGRWMEAQVKATESTLALFTRILEMGQTGEHKLSVQKLYSSEPEKILEDCAEYISSHKVPTATEKKIEGSCADGTDG